MKEVPIAVIKAVLTIAVICVSPFAKKLGEGLAEKENWQFWKDEKPEALYWGKDEQEKKDEITPLSTEDIIEDYTFNPKWAPVVDLVACDEITPLSTEDIDQEKEKKRKTS